MRAISLLILPATVFLRTIVLTTAWTAAGLLSTFQLSAQAGALDPTFGQGGRVTFGFDTPSSDNDPTVVAIQTDGKVVVAGRAFYLPNAAIQHVGVARLLPNGDLDPSFSGDGKAGFLLDPSVSVNTPRAMCLLPDGKILMVVAGSISKHFFLRLLPNGDPDPTFGINGVVKIFSTMESGGGQNFAYSMAVQTNGKILLAFRANYSAPVSAAALIVARFLSNGSPDNTFGGTGRIAVDSASTVAPLTGPIDHVKMALLSGNKILLAGDTVLLNSPFNGIPKLIRLNTDGTFDASFGTNGQVKLANIQLSARDLQVDAAQNIFLSGESGGNRPIVKILPSGAVDATYGTNGVASGGLNFSVSTENSLVLSNGNAVLGGISNATGFIQTILKRFDSGGDLDLSFGVGGVSLIPQVGDENVLRFMAVQPDGKVLVVGKRKAVSGTTISEFEVMRLNAATSPVQDVFEKTDFQIWPNPAGDFLRVSLSGSTQGATLSLFSADGNWLRSQSAHEGDQEIDLKGLPPGNYFLQANAPGRASAAKAFVKND